MITDQSIFTKSQPKEISEGLQNFIDSMVEEIVLEGKPFDTQKKYLRKFSENEGLDYKKFEANFSTFIEIIDNIKETPNKPMEKYAIDKGHDCFISDFVITKMLETVGNHQINNTCKSLSFIEWGSIDKVEFSYGDRSVPPRYHRSYTISITRNENTLVVDSYGSVLLTRNYSNNQKNFEDFKETLANIGIYTHDIVRDGRCGITTLYLKLYDGNECVFSGYTTNTEGKYGNMYLPKESVVLFHNEIPESVGSLIQETRDKMEKEIKEEEEKIRIEKEAKLKKNLTQRYSKYRAIFESLSEDMIYIEGGTFWMGSDSEESYGDEKPIHKVTLSPFYICRYEVTQVLWQAVMDSNPSNFKDDRRPVEQVSWDDCQAFIRKLNQLTGKEYRLPTEAEWEYAARGGNKSKGYKFSGSNNIDEVAWYTKTTNDDGTHLIGQKQPNELGLYDMSGNVWEWCRDRYDSYDNSEQINPRGSENGSNYVYRGGGYNSDTRNCRVFRRNRFRSPFRYVNLGFRLAMSVDRATIKSDDVIKRPPRILPPKKFENLGILVLDGSGSMEEMTARSISKAETVTMALNDLFSRCKGSINKYNFSFAIVNYDHRSIVKMKPTPVKDVDDHGDYNPMESLGGGTYISEGLKDAKIIAEDFLSQTQGGGGLPRHVVVMILTDGVDMTQAETISLAHSLRQMDNVTVAGCFFETIGYDTKEMDSCSDYIKSLCSEERLFARVKDYLDLRSFFMDSISSTIPFLL